MDSKSAKYSLWGAIFAAAITAVVALYIHFDKESEKKEIAEKTAKEDKRTARLDIVNVYLPPINTTQDSIFYAEVLNDSFITAKDLTIKVNFGEANVKSCETLPINYISKNNTFETSFVSFPYEELAKDEKFYIYCTISQPTFESIFISGDNLFENPKLRSSDLSTDLTENNSSFVKFFKVVASIVAVIFIIFFTIALLVFLNKKAEKLGVKIDL